MSQESLDDIMARVAKAVSWRYARRVWWADQSELEQQAWIICLEVRQQYAKSGTNPESVFGGSCYVACMRQLSRWLRYESSPVSSSNAGLKDMETFTRVSTRTIEDTHLVAGPDDAYEEAEVLHKLRATILELCGDTPDTRGAILVLMGGLTSSEAAEQLDLDIGSLYEQTRMVKNIVRTDSNMRNLAEELAHRRWFA